MTNTSLFRPILPLAIALLWGCNGGDNSSGDNSNGENRNDPKDRTYTVTGQLNDTGIELCATAEAIQQACPQSALPGQDAEAGRDLLAAKGQLTKQGAGIAGFDWTKLDSNGNALPVQDQPWNNDGNEAAGSRWSCVRDNVTGLTWEIRESDPEHPRYAGHVFRWWLDGDQYNSGFPDMNNSGRCSFETCDLQTYVNWVNENGLCGASDWRMPSVTELSSIAVLSKVMPAVDTDYFPDIEITQVRFFTNQTLARDPSRAWYVYFSDASASFTNKGDASHVRLVRGGQP
jgi:hypothetical protein